MGRGGAAVKVRDFVGRRVRLLQRVETRCGDVFDVGDVLTVESVWRGRLTLRPGPDDARKGIRHLHRDLVEVQGA